MEKQTIIVTGATSEIGTEIIRRFVKKGDNLVINALSKQKLEEVYQKFGAGESVIMMAGDCGDRPTVIKLLAIATAQFGAVNVLINIAENFKTTLGLSEGDAYVERTLKTNLSRMVCTTLEIVQQMYIQQNGIVINIGPPYEQFMPGEDKAEKEGNSTIELHKLSTRIVAHYGQFNIRFNTVELGTANHIGELKEIAHMVYTIAKSKFISSDILIK